MIFYVTYALKTVESKLSSVRVAEKEQGGQESFAV